MYYFSSLCLHTAVPDDKSIEAKCTALQEFVKQLEAEIEVLKKKEVLNRIDVLIFQSSSQSEELCVICCSTPIDTKFEPCHHESCRLCIKRHLLNRFNQITSKLIFAAKNVSFAMQKSLLFATQQQTNQSKQFVCF